MLIKVCFFLGGFCLFYYHVLFGLTYKWNKIHLALNVWCNEQLKFESKRNDDSTK